jgi:hypothetical protein
LRLSFRTYVPANGPDPNSFYGCSALISGRGFPVAPVCGNCGASDFVWVNDIKTGTLGGGTLSLRSRGELALGTRICRSCGHADLFLKDPSILRMPHTWKPGEFVPIPAHPANPGPATNPPAAPSPPPATPPPPPAPAPEPPLAPPIAPPDPPASPDAPTLSDPAPATGSPGPDSSSTASPGEPTSAPPAKRASRRRATKSKTEEPPPSA